MNSKLVRFIATLFNREYNGSFAPLIWTVFFFVICGCGVPSANEEAEADELIKNLDLKNGFRDAKLRSIKSSFQNLKFVRSYPDCNEYIRITDKLLLGDFKLDSIKYCFEGDSLKSITIVLNGYSNCNGVYRALEELFGIGDGKFLQCTSWTGEKIWLSYIPDPQSDDRAFVMYHVLSRNSVHNKVDTVEVEVDRKIQRAIKDL